MATRKKKEIEEIDLRLRVENFHKRWNIDLSEENRWSSFKNRVLNSYAKILGLYILANSKREDEFYSLIGIHKKSSKNIFDYDLLYDKKLSESPTYNYFLNTSDIKKFILGLEVIFWMDTIEWKNKFEFWEEIEDIIITTGVPLVAKETEDGEYLFYPSGAKLLDRDLVNDNLDWLMKYPEVYKVFKSALLEIDVKDKSRNVIDNLRLSLELLLKILLNNQKSLENQKVDIGKYLKEKNVSTEISNLFWLVIDYYSKYQNSKIKHSNKVKSEEVEFLLYLTGVLLRFLLKN